MHLTAISGVRHKRSACCRSVSMPIWGGACFSGIEEYEIVSCDLCLFSGMEGIRHKRSAYWMAVSMPIWGGTCYSGIEELETVSCDLCLYGEEHAFQA